MSAAPLLRAENLTKSYGTTAILHGLSLSLGEGESLAVLGASGSGKTTLLSLLAGLDAPDTGQVYWRDQDLSRLRPDDLARLRGREVGIIFQEYHLVPGLSALENIALPLEIAKAPAGEAKEKALEMLERVGLAARARHLPHQLSGGEQQRVAIARALVQRPRILFADEPTGSLDEATGAQVEDLVFSLIREEGLAALLITHNKSLASRCGRVMRLRAGHLETPEGF